MGDNAENASVDDSDLPEVNDPDNDGPYYCNSTETQSGDPCGIRVSNPYQTCGKHPNPVGPPPGNDNAVANDGGAPEGNDNAAGHGAPEGNTNAMKHGEYMNLKRKRDALIDKYGREYAQQYFERLEDFRGKCRNESRAHKLAILDVLEDIIIDDVMDEQLTATFYSEGTPYEAFDTDRMDAAESLDNRVRMGLHYEGESAVGSSGGGQAGHDNLNQLVSPDSDDAADAGGNDEPQPENST